MVSGCDHVPAIGFRSSISIADENGSSTSPPKLFSDLAPEAYTRQQATRRLTALDGDRWRKRRQPRLIDSPLTQLDQTALTTAEMA